MESEPFVSIVIPTTGKIKFIRGLVKSVIELDYPKEKFELILIGDEPTELLEKHSTIAKESGVNTIVKYVPVAAGPCLWKLRFTTTQRLQDGSAGRSPASGMRE